jgi:hypothetical protein
MNQPSRPELSTLPVLGTFYLAPAPVGGLAGQIRVRVRGYLLARPFTCCKAETRDILGGFAR